MQSWGLTDPGCVRKQNQDAYQIEKLDRSSLLCVVCDGMGGAKSGNIASTLAVEVFAEEIRRSWVRNMDDDKVDQMMRSAVKLANFTVFDQAVQFEEFSGMGTTLVAALIRENEATLVNVGDSRAYGINRNGIHLLTISKRHLKVNRNKTRYAQFIPKLLHNHFQFLNIPLEEIDDSLGIQFTESFLRIAFRMIHSNFKGFFQRNF